MRIYLIGFMGSGKTFTGKQLAGKLGYSFLDLDDLIEKEADMDISAIFQEYGESYFRKLEQQVLKLTADRQEVVISTGGGTPCYFDNIGWMNEHGISIFLDTPPELLARRLLPERAHRPLLQAYDEKTLPAFIQSKLQERMYFYEKAEIRYLQQEPAGDVAEELLKIINGKRKT